MDWLDELDEFGFNIVIDELVYQLREDRKPTGVVKRLLPEAGVEFQFAERDAEFLPIHASILDLNWSEAIEIIADFPQIGPLEFREA